MAKVVKELWGGVIKYEDQDDDPPLDVRYFNNFGKSVILWGTHSRSLHRAAVALMRPESMWCPAMTPEINAPIALMLGGYAVETLLKMVVVDDHGVTHGLDYDARRADDFLPATHNLGELVKQAGLRTNKADRELLAKLSAYTTWAGRYPVPRKAEGYDGDTLFDLRGNAERSRIWTAYVPLYEKLYRLAGRKIALWGMR
jgi:hypothetical protein